MFRLLQQPAPYIFEWNFLLLRHLLYGAIVAFSLIVFQPFGTAEVQMPNKSLFLSGYGGITFLVFSLVCLIAPKLFPKWFQEERWKVWKEIVLHLIILSILFFSCYCYMQLWFGWSISLRGFLHFFPIGLSFSAIPVFFGVLLHYIYHLKKHQNIATSFNEKIPNIGTTVSPTMISFKDENDREDFSLPKDQLLFLKAANNYVEIYYQEGEEVKMHLLRNRLSKLEQQLVDNNIIRCHRSYLVNIERAGRITGNAQGYKLHFPFTAEYLVPVSRTKGKELLAMLQGI